MDIGILIEEHGYLELLLEDLRRHETWIFTAIAAAGLVAWLVLRRRSAR